MRDARPPLTKDGKPRAFFGRRAGKGLNIRQRQLVETLLPKVEIALDSTAVFEPQRYFEDGTAPLWVEIGYGGGEHLARLAMQNPKTNFIGAEVFSGGIGKMLEKIADAELGNVRLFTGDALDLLTRLGDSSVEGIYLLYPDPWPKSRHHKRRFVSATTLGELERVIKRGGFFRVATDIEDYANWVLAHMVRSRGFGWDAGAEGWHQPFEGWVPTRYETKAGREGRLRRFYFDFVRNTGKG